MYTGHERVRVGWVEGQHTAARHREQNPIAPRLDRVCVCECVQVRGRGGFKAVARAHVHASL